jgi:hypothetical protein
MYVLTGGSITESGDAAALLLHGSITDRKQAKYHAHYVHTPVNGSRNKKVRHQI